VARHLPPLLAILLAMNEDCSDRRANGEWLVVFYDYGLAED